MSQPDPNRRSTGTPLIWAFIFGLAPFFVGGLAMLSTPPSRNYAGDGGPNFLPLIFLAGEGVVILIFSFIGTVICYTYAHQDDGQFEDLWPIAKFFNYGLLFLGVCGMLGSFGGWPLAMLPVLVILLLASQKFRASRARKARLAKKKKPDQPRPQSPASP